MSLSPTQLAAAHRMGQDVCVIAGPGSGKTSVLIERFSWLVNDRGVSPRRVLAITFTEKAANEIKQRLVSAFADNPALREQIEHAYVSTIDGFCARLLRENAIEAGVDPEFSVLDEGAAASLRRESADEVLETLYRDRRADVVRLLRALAVSTMADGFTPDLATSLIDIYEAIRVNGATVDEAVAMRAGGPSAYDRVVEELREVLREPLVLKTPNQREAHGKFNDAAREFLTLPERMSERHLLLVSQMKMSKSRFKTGSRAREMQDMLERLRGEYLAQFYARERELIGEALIAFERVYRAKKRMQSVLDFADLEEQAIALLRMDEALRERVRNTFDHILMDELQDTNPLQWDLLGLVRREGNFFAVGDVNQSIFGFRYAEPELFHGYRQELDRAGKTVDFLHENFRSRPELLDAVNRVFLDPVDGIDAHTLTSGSKFAEKAVPSLELNTAFAEDSDKAEEIEALWVARRITELVGTDSTGKLGRERPITLADIAILTRTYRAMEPIQRALDAFRIPSIVLGGRTFFETREVRDLVLLLRVLANPLDEIALVGVLRAPLGGVPDEQILRWKRDERPLWESALETDFGVQLARLRGLRDDWSPDRLLRAVLDDRDYESNLSPRARSNVEKFLGMLRARFEGAPLSLRELLFDIEAIAPEAEAPPADFGNAVRLMSVHKAKGLEFPVVILPALHKGGADQDPVIAYSRTDGIGVRWRDPFSGSGASDLVHKEICSACEESRKSEDFRLLYVAMTRAQDHMVLSFARRKDRSQKWWDFICPKLGVGDEPLNRVVEQNGSGVRVHFTDVEPAVVEAEAIRMADQPKPVLAAPLAGPQYDSAVSVTSVSAYASCPRKYYLQRYLKWSGEDMPGLWDEPEHPPAEPDRLEAAEFGTRVHALLAGSLDGAVSGEERRLVDRFRASEIGRAAAKAQVVRHEFDFLFALEDTVLRGMIDLWFEDRGKITIVDYKTDRIAVADVAERSKGYDLQLQVYAMALEHLTGKPVSRAVLYFLRPDLVHDVDLSPLQLHGARQAVSEFLRAQDRVEFPLRAGPQCSRCEFFRGACPSSWDATPELASDLLSVF